VLRRGVEEHRDERTAGIHAKHVLVVEGDPPEASRPVEGDRVAPAAQVARGVEVERGVETEGTAVQHRPEDESIEGDQVLVVHDTAEIDRRVEGEQQVAGARAADGVHANAVGDPRGGAVEGNRVEAAFETRDVPGCHDEPARQGHGDVHGEENASTRLDVIGADVDPVRQAAEVLDRDGAGVVRHLAVEDGGARQLDGHVGGRRQLVRRSRAGQREPDGEGHRQRLEAVRSRTRHGSTSGEAAAPRSHPASGDGDHPHPAPKAARLLEQKLMIA
jgi:hypothetical protein